MVVIGRPIAYGVVATGALFYAGIVVAAIGIVVSAKPDDRATLLLAAVLALLFGLFAALIVGLTFVPAYFIARRTGGGALPYLMWGAGSFGLVAWRLVAEDGVRVHGAMQIALACIAVGALLGATFWLGVRRSLRDR